MAASKQVRKTNITKFLRVVISVQAVRHWGVLFRARLLNLRSGVWCMLDYLRKEELASFLFDVRYVILFYVLGDWLTTMYALEYGFEANLLPALVIAKYGIFHVLLLKFIFMVLLFRSYRVIRIFPWLWDFTRKTVAGIGLVVSVENFMVILLGSRFFHSLFVFS